MRTFSSGTPSTRRKYSAVSAPVDFNEHDIDKNLGLVKAVGLKGFSQEMIVHYGRRDEEYAAKLLKGKCTKKDFLIAMHVGSKEKMRIWPTENYAKVSDQSLKRAVSSR